MRGRSLPNRRGVAWLLSVAFILMASVSGASWQCLDGHACPSGCTMQRVGAGTHGNASLPACCRPRQSGGMGMAHCALCSSASPKHAQMRERCTSPVCVLRVQVKPDINTQAHFHFVFDTTAVLLPCAAPALLPEQAAPLTFGSPRAPPGRMVLRPSSPRAPPTLL